MAENKILYRITVDAKTATGTISNMSGGFKRTQIAVEDLNEVLGEMNGEMSRTTGGIGRTMGMLKRQRSNLQINSKEYQNVTKSMRFYQSQMDMSTGATGSASSAAMELGRVYLTHLMVLEVLRITFLSLLLRWLLLLNQQVAYHWLLKIYGKH